MDNSFFRRWTYRIYCRERVYERKLRRNGSKRPLGYCAKRLMLKEIGSPTAVAEHAMKKCRPTPRI
jgi:hypothetical protein